MNCHLVPALGRFPLTDLERKPELLDSLVAKMVKQGLEPKTIRNHMGALRVMLNQAVRRRHLRINPAISVELPKLTQAEMNILTEVEISRLWKAYGELDAQSPDDGKDWWRLSHTLTFVALGTAMRRGELLGLRWRDVQMLESRVEARTALVRGRVTTPKSRAGQRIIEVGSETTNLLQRHWQASAYCGDDDFVFCHPTKGTPLDPSKL